MSGNQDNKILGLPRRPRLADASAGAILGALAAGWLTGRVIGTTVGGLAENALANQPLSLEMALRNYFAGKKIAGRNLQVIFFYRAPRAVKVSFSYAPNAYWTVETVMPDDLQLEPEDRDDWLYGSIVAQELPKILRKISRHLRQK